ncbi:ESX secretion-associated protein EspG [Rhodococcus yananensis]|uniref:ESX secretion-associated protein EspG n=1 Tax=Rhodococcus yananensis TaxID=2879464 RepID=UPI001CF914DB|nr:ESX secretion-associated protein EspG [Rhodococcus yananensis]
MNRTVTLDQFLSLWTAVGGDRFPFPLRYRTPAKWEDEHAAHMHAADDWCRAHRDIHLDRAIRLLHSGHISVEMYGQHGDRDIRVRAACGDTLAMLAVQRDDRAIDLTTTSADTLASAVLTEIPAATPGREPSSSAPTRLLSEPTDFRSVRVGLVDDGPRALRHLLTLERSGWGNIRVLVTDAVGRTTGIADVGWIDVAGDGRYLLTTGTHTTASPASSSTMQAELSRVLTNARRRRRGEVRLPGDGSAHTHADRRADFP